MRSLCRAAIMTTMLAGVCAVADTAEAQTWFGFNGMNTGYPGYSVYVQNQLPYFSQHPPVYYSYPVARPYGYSPYAYPGWTPTPQPDPVKFAPRIVVNPYIVEPLPEPPAKKSAGVSTSAGAEMAASTNATTPRPKMIINPFVSEALAKE